MIFAIDTNILVYAHNFESPYYQKAEEFMERVVKESGDINGLALLEFHCKCAQNSSMS